MVAKNLFLLAKSLCFSKKKNPTIIAWWCRRKSKIPHAQSTSGANNTNDLQSGVTLVGFFCSASSGPVPVLQREAPSSVICCFALPQAARAVPACRQQTETTTHTTRIHSVAAPNIPPTQQWVGLCRRTGGPSHCRDVDTPDAAPADLVSWIPFVSLKTENNPIYALRLKRDAEENDPFSGFRTSLSPIDNVDCPCVKRKRLWVWDGHHSNSFQHQTKQHSAGVNDKRS